MPRDERPALLHHVIPEIAEDRWFSAYEAGELIYLGRPKPRLREVQRLENLLSLYVLTGWLEARGDLVDCPLFRRLAWDEPEPGLAKRFAEFIADHANTQLCRENALLLPSIREGARELGAPTLEGRTYTELGEPVIVGHELPSLHRADKGVRLCPPHLAGYRTGECRALWTPRISAAMMEEWIEKMPLAQGEKDREPAECLVMAANGLRIPEDLDAPYDWELWLDYRRMLDFVAKQASRIEHLQDRLRYITDHWDKVSAQGIADRQNIVRPSERMDNRRQMEQDLQHIIREREERCKMWERFFAELWPVPKEQRMPFEQWCEKWKAENPTPAEIIEREKIEDAEREKKENSEQDQKEDTDGTA